MKLFINSEFSFTFNDYKPQDTPESSTALQSCLNHPGNEQLNMLDSFPPHRTSSIIMLPFPWPKWALPYDFAVLKIIEMNLKKKKNCVYDWWSTMLALDFYLYMCNQKNRCICKCMFKNNTMYACSVILSIQWKWNLDLFVLTQTYILTFGRPPPHQHPGNYHHTRCPTARYGIPPLDPRMHAHHSPSEYVWTHQLKEKISFRSSSTCI